MNDIRQQDMADQLAVSRATLINYEKGHTTINVDVLDRLKNAYPDFEIEEKNPFVGNENFTIGSSDDDTTGGPDDDLTAQFQSMSI